MSDQENDTKKNIREFLRLVTADRELAHALSRYPALTDAEVAAEDIKILTTLLHVATATAAYAAYEIYTPKVERPGVVTADMTCAGMNGLMLYRDREVTLYT